MDIIYADVCSAISLHKISLLNNQTFFIPITETSSVLDLLKDMI